MITVQDIAKLREKTGVGILDCRKALVECNEDFEKAIEWLREKGIATASKKADRIAAEGTVSSFVDDGKTGALVEVNCETDFAAKNEKFQQFAKDIAKQISKTNPAYIRTEEVPAGKNAVCLLDMAFINDSSKSVTNINNELIQVIGEKISVRRFVRYALTGNGLISTYIHLGGKIGILVELAFDKAETAKDVTVQQLGRDVAMQIAAANPLFVKDSEVPASVLEHEKQILLAQAKNEGKPEAVAIKMVEGRIKKYYKDNCLVDMEFVKDPSKNISTVVSEVSKAVNDNISIVRFTRYQMGEGLVKRSDNLADEVAKQIQ